MWLSKPNSATNKKRKSQALKASCVHKDQGRNEVCGIRDQKGGIWDHSHWIRDHRPWDRDQQLFRDQGSGCTIFVGSGKKIGHAFGIKDHKFAYKNGISDEKTYLVTTL